MDKNIQINKDRLWQSLMEMAKIGPGATTGSNRQALTDADNQGRNLFKSWCQNSGMSISVDQMGTMFATRPGSNPNALPVVMGSHLDTQPTGGKFDGVLGVLSGLEVVRTLNDLNITTERPIVIVNWTNEEGSRFVPSMIASGVYAGVYDIEYAHNRKDANGKSLKEELIRTGWLGLDPVGQKKMHVYFEYHIEQGPILEAQNKTIGVVTHGQGQSWLEVTLTGREAHTGSTPMNMRSNACLAMAKIINIVHDIAMNNQPFAACSVAKIDLSPNSRNVLPGKAIFTIDIRAADQDKFQSMCAMIEKEIKKISSEQNVGCSIELIGHYAPVSFNEQLISIVRDNAIKLGYSYMDICSGAGHDAFWISKIVPSVMIMCPCIGGMSHNECEDITPEWATAGANVLLHSVTDIAIKVF